jgi:hypothetical protein
MSWDISPGQTTALVPGLVVPAAKERGLKGLEE